MAAGLPILAARLGGMAEIVQEGEAGCLFDPENETEFRQKLEHLILNPALREQMGNEALRLARSCFDLESVTRQIATPLLDLTQKASIRPHEVTTR
jgi:glycosyltransferase involved in cell wall biosynthesis